MSGHEGRGPGGREDVVASLPWVLRVTLGSHRPGPAKLYRGMVYLHPPGARPELHARRWDADGIPLWCLTPARTTLRELRTAEEQVPRDRRYLKGWARAIRPLEVNVEVSDLGTVLHGRYEVPVGLWLHTLLAGEVDGAPPMRRERLERVGDPPGPPLELSHGTVRYHMSVERQGQEGGP